MSTPEKKKPQSKTPKTNRPVVYLAGAISHAHWKFCRAWRNTARVQLERLGYVVHNPIADKDLTQDYDPTKIVEEDLSMVDDADYLLAEVSIRDYPYIGTSMEIRYAWERQKGIIVWTEVHQENYFLVYHADHIVPSLRDALEQLDKARQLSITADFLKEGRRK